MKIAIPTKDDMVEDHFGHCETFTIVEISEQNSVLSKEQLYWTAGCGCKSNIVQTLRDMNVEAILAGNMGQGALNVLHCHGMSVIRGCSGLIDEVLNKYLRDEIRDKGIICRSSHHH